MKKLFVITLIALASMLVGAVIKESKQGGSIEFYTNESGTVTKKAEITAAGKMKVNQIEDLAGGIPPGMVPLGGMIAVMPTVDASAWQPPESGAIKDGFMRADGHQITSGNVAAGCKLAEGTYLPNMVSMVARGGTASCDGSVECQSKSGGNDNYTLTMNNIPQHNHNLSGNVAGGTASLTGNVAGGTASLTGSVTGGTASGNFASTTHTHGLPGHNHGMSGSLGQTLSVDIDHNHPAKTSGAGSNHTHSITHDHGSFGSATESGHTHGQSVFASTTGGSGIGWAADFFTGSGANPQNLATQGSSGHIHTIDPPNFSGTSGGESSHTHSVDLDALGITAKTPTGNIGKVTNGCAGDTTDNCSTSSISGTASVSNTPASNGTLAVSNTAANNGTLSVSNTPASNGTLAVDNAGQESPTAVDTLPNYQNVVWVIRVY